MQLELTVNSVAGQRKLDIIVEALSDLDPVLKRFGKFLRHRAQERFDAEGPGWAKLASSTIEARQHTQEVASERIRRLANYRLRRKLQRELRRAQSKFSAAAAIQRYEVLKEFERLVAGGAAGLSLVSGENREKVAKKLRGRIERAHVAASSKILGRMASSIGAKVSKGFLIVRSSIRWAGAHNEGAIVGHGAVLPARVFLTIEDGDADVLIELLIDYSLAAVR